MNCYVAIIYSVVQKSSYKPFKLSYALKLLKPIKCSNCHKSISLEISSNYVRWVNILRSHSEKVLRKLKYFSRYPIKKVNLKGKALLCSLAFFGPNNGLFTSSSPRSASKFEYPAMEITSIPERKQRNLFLKTILYIYESIRIVFRFLRHCCTFLPVIILSPAIYLGFGAQELWWKLLLAAIEFSGPIFIKFGQWASTRRDLFPERCCHHLSRLQRRATPHSYYYTKLILKKTFGKNWRKIFVKFDNNKEPIGSGCVAQVYKVWICPDEVENKEIIEEIIKEEEDETILHFADGFGSLFKSRKDEAKEEEDAIAEWQRKRNIQIEARRELEKLSVGNSQIASSVHGVTQNLAEKIVNTGDNDNKHDLQNGLHNTVKDDITSADINETDEFHEGSENLLEHALVEEWQHGTDNLEKSFPWSGNQDFQDFPEDLDGLVPVAVKVLHPNIYRVFRRDLLILRCCAKFISTIYPPLKWLSLEGCVDEFSKVMSAQLDLKVEAKNMEKFAKSFAHVDCIRFPRPLRPFVNRMVLTETFEDGEPLMNFIVEERCEAVKKNLAKIGVDSLIKMIFVDNFIHGDLHPGNIIVQNYDASNESQSSDGNHSKLMMIDVGSDIFVMDIQPDPRPLRICMLDCGIVATLKEKDLESLKDVFKQVCLGDGPAVADLFLINSEHDCKEPELFKQDMSRLVENARKNSVTLGQVDVGILLQQVLSLLLQHRVRLESAFSAVVLAVFVLEGIGRSLDPEMDILERTRPVLVEKPSFWSFMRKK